MLSFESIVPFQTKTGTSATPIQSNLRWGCDDKLANRICNYNRHWAESSGYFMSTSFVKEAGKVVEEESDITFYDSNSGMPLFVAPKVRPMKVEINCWIDWVLVGSIAVYISELKQTLCNDPLPWSYIRQGRSFEDFVNESKKHGWPSFRDEEVVWENTRVLPGGETVSVDGTHLGHNLPDSLGNRYCINLVCVAGRPIIDSKEED